MSLFITIAIVQIIALMSPGPDFFFVSQTAVSRSRHEAMAGVAGITLGVAMWAALALLGLQLLLHRLIWLERLIAVCGGLYLCWMGLKMLRGAFARPAQGQTAEPVQVFAGAWRSLRNGLFTNLANPKVVIYFGSIFSAFVGTGVSSAARWGPVGHGGGRDVPVVFVRGGVFCVAGHASRLSAHQSLDRRLCRCGVHAVRFAPDFFAPRRLNARWHS